MNVRKWLTRFLGGFLGFQRHNWGFGFQISEEVSSG